MPLRTGYGGIAVIIVCALGGLCASGPGMAQSTATKDEISAAFVGKTARFPDGSTATYYANGAFSYVSRSVAHGTYKIDDGKICVTYPGNVRRCDTIMKNGDSYILVNERGRSFPLTLF